MTTEQPRARGRIAEHVALIALAGALFTAVGLLRVVDDDEGFYALAGRAMVLEGLVPYRDFFLPQLPGAPAVFGLVQAVVGVGLGPLRVAGAVGATLSVWVVFAATRHLGRTAALGAAALYAGHAVTWEWAGTVKTFPVVLPLLAGALWCAASATRPRGLLLAGLLAGLASSVRAMAGPVALAVLAAAWTPSCSAAERRRRVVATALGVAAGLLPVALVAMIDPPAFVFDNVGYHAIRAPGEGLVKDLPQKLETLRDLLLPPLGAAGPDVTGLQTVVLVALAGVGARGAGSWARPFVAAASLLTLVALLPSPTWTQYFALVLVPLSVLAGRGLSKIPAPRAAEVLVAGYLVAASAMFSDRIVAQPPLARPAAFDRVGRALDEVTRPGDRVAAHFPAYLVSSRRTPIEEARNQFARLYSERVSGADRQRFHLHTESDFRDALVSRRASAFVLGMSVVPETALEARATGWVRAVDLPGASVWVVPERSP